MKRIAPLLALALTLSPLSARAQPASNPSAAASRAVKQQAASRFRKGLELYNDGDFEAALIEFRRAYELAPSYQVLYNIGQVYFQLQDYAGALTALERYLSEGGAGLSANRRAEVEKDLAKLRQRVAYLQVSTNVDDAEVTLDDALLGKTPFPKPILISAGKHKLTATKPGRETATKVFEIASGDKLELSLALVDPTASAPAPPPPAPVVGPKTSESERQSLVWVGWVATGALAVGAGVFGGLALTSSADLATQRSAPGATRAALDSGSSKTKTFALVSDLCAASAVVAGGVTLYFTLRKPSKPKPEVHLGLHLGGLAVDGSF